MVFLKAKSMDDVHEAIKKYDRIILDFSTPTCHPCKIFEAVVKDLMEKYPEINVINIDIREIPEAREKYDIMGVPNIHFYEKGKLIERFEGYSEDIPEIVLEEWFKLVKIFLINFKDDIYNFARVGDRVIELEKKEISQKVLPIKNRVYQLNRMWSEDSIDGKTINEAIAPRKVGVSKSPVTKWEIVKIEEAKHG